MWIALCGKVSLEKSEKRPEDRVHKLKGRTADRSSRGKEMIDIHQSLDAYFEDLRQRGLPFATRVIRDEKGTTTRDDNVGDVVLPLISPSGPATLSGVMVGDGKFSIQNQL